MSQFLRSFLIASPEGGAFELFAPHDPRDFVTALLRDLPLRVKDMFGPTDDGDGSIRTCVAHVDLDDLKKLPVNYTGCGLVADVVHKRYPSVAPLAVVVSFEYESALLPDEKTRAVRLIPERLQVEPLSGRTVYVLRSVAFVALGHYMCAVRENGTWYVADDVKVNSRASFKALCEKVMPSFFNVAGFFPHRSVPSAFGVLATRTGVLRSTGAGG